MCNAKKPYELPSDAYSTCYVIQSCKHTMNMTVRLEIPNAMIRKDKKLHFIKLIVFIFITNVYK